MCAKMAIRVRGERNALSPLTSEVSVILYDPRRERKGDKETGSEIVSRVEERETETRRAVVVTPWKEIGGIKVRLSQ